MPPTAPALRPVRVSAFALLLVMLVAGAPFVTPAFASPQGQSPSPAQAAPAQAPLPAVADHLVADFSLSALADAGTLVAASSFAPTGLAPVKRLPAPRSSDRGLFALFASYATLQALDVHSTLTAIHNGTGTEANTFLKPLVDRPVAFIAFKSAITAGSILAARKLAGHNRVAAYALMVGLNSAYAMVVYHNYGVAGTALPRQ